MQGENAYEQRRWNRQPDGGCSSDGGVPGIGFRSAPSADQPRQRVEQAPGVGVLGAVEDVLVAALLDRLGRVHDQHVVGRLGDHAEVVRDQDDGAAEVALQLVHQLQDLGLGGHVERRGGLVGDQQVGVVDERHRDHHALPHSARELVRVVVHARLGARDGHGLQHLHRAAVGDLLADVLVQLHRLAQLRADRVDRVQRRHRVLEDHRDLVAADLAQLVGVDLQQIPVLEDRLALGHGVPLRVQAHDRHAGDALAAARLAHDRERLALLDAERDAVHRVDDAVIRAEVRLQILDVKQRHARNCTGSGPVWTGAGSGQPDPWVNHRVQEVDHQVEDDHHDRGEDHRAR